MLKPKHAEIAQKERHDTIRTWALVVTGITSTAVIGFAWWLIDILNAPDWCERAVGAGQDANARPFLSVQACFDLLRIQVEALALNSHMLVGTLALCLAVLVVIVLAGGKVSFTASKDGASANIGSDHPEVEGAKRVAEAATQESAQVEKEARAPDRPMPEPELPMEDK
jgi:hypothetical protein